MELYIDSASNASRYTYRAYRSVWNEMDFLYCYDFIKNGVGSDDYFFTNYPNPFESSTTISFNNNTKGMVSLTLTDMNGRLIKVLHSGDMPAGVQQVLIDGNGLASGMYILSLDLNGVKSSRKIFKD